MSDIYLTSDLHFYHTNILKFNPSTRPFVDLDDMHESIINHINNTMKPSDRLYHLGDFSFAKDPQRTIDIVNKIDRQIYLIRGNHCYHDHWKHVLPECKNIVWQKDYYELKHNKTKICLFHFPMMVWNSSHYGSLHAFGHCHGSLQHPGKAIDVGWDAHGKILHVDEFISLCNDKPKYQPSHHNGD